MVKYSNTENKKKEKILVIMETQTEFHKKSLVSCTFRRKYRTEVTTAEKIQYMCCILFKIFIYLHYK